MAAALIPILILAVLYAIRSHRHNRSLISSWISIQAGVIFVQYKKETGNDNLSRMDILYEYEYRGRKYKGTKAALGDVFDNENESAIYSPEIYNKLKSAKENNEPITIWVNPDNPKLALVSNNPGKGAELFLWFLIVASLYIMYYMFSRDSW